MKEAGLVIIYENLHRFMEDDLEQMNSQFGNLGGSSRLLFLVVFFFLWLWGTRRPLLSFFWYSLGQIGGSGTQWTD